MQLKVQVETNLDCSSEKAWDLVSKSETLLHVAKPLARIEPVGEPFPDKWTERGQYQCKSYLFGFLPVGLRTIF